jgi:hypothetical protein
LDKLGHGFTVGGYGLDGGRFIFAHKAAVTFDIGAEYCAEFTFYAVGCHSDFF